MFQNLNTWPSFEIVCRHRHVALNIYLTVVGSNHSVSDYKILVWEHPLLLFSLRGLVPIGPLLLLSKFSSYLHRVGLIGGTDIYCIGHNCSLNMLAIIGPEAGWPFNWNFHPLEVASRWRDPQLKVSENYSNWCQQFWNVTDSRTQAVGFHYETYCEIVLSPERFAVQFDLEVLNRYSYEKMHTASLGTARWAHLSTRRHIKPSPKCSGLMW